MSSTNSIITDTIAVVEPATSSSTALPRIAITYCTQCRWMLRAAYFAQELLTTFSTAIGEVALIPATGGLFQVVLTFKSTTPASEADVNSGTTASSDEATGSMMKTVLLWDRKTEGGFPETKILKQRVRDHIQPEKDLGHSDKHGKQGKVAKQEEEGAASAPTKPEDCTTCP